LVGVATAPMGRYRAPDPPSSPYITPAGYQNLQDEQKRLWKFRREVAEAVSVAAAEGDRSENAEYIYRKKQLRELDRRIRYLQKRLPILRVIDSVGNREQIFFGAFVTLIDDNGEKNNYQIVGPDEIDPEGGNISIDSPVAKALLKKRCGDHCSVTVGENERSYTVLAIDYGK